MSNSSARRPGRFRQNIIALCYDFDGTLSRRNMQEETIFAEYHIDGRAFWRRINRDAKDAGYDKVLCYLNRLIFDAKFQAKPLTAARLTAMARRIHYFPGVEAFLPHINDVVRREAASLGAEIHLEHYLISSGMKAILQGVSIRKYFKEIYACEYEYRSNGAPRCVKLAINDTTKTQFLSRINKGRLRLDQDINQHMTGEARRIPFQNMLYIGDGDSDVPCMAVTMRSGGYAVAVYPPERTASTQCRQLFQANRVNHIAPADFTPGSPLVRILATILKTMAQQIVLRQSIFHQQRAYSRGLAPGSQGSA